MDVSQTTGTRSPHAGSPPASTRRARSRTRTHTAATVDAAGNATQLELLPALPTFERDDATAVSRYARSAFSDPCEIDYGNSPAESGTPALYIHDGAGPRPASDRAILQSAYAIVAERCHRGVAIFAQPNLLEIFLRIRLGATAVRRSALSSWIGIIA
jgi:hypothetical protein